VLTKKVADDPEQKTPRHAPEGALFSLRF